MPAGPSILEVIPHGSVVLAPMAGIADQAFRTICLRHGADFTYSEMVSAAGVVFGSSRTHSLDIAAPAPGEARYALQLFGSDPALISEAIAILESHYSDAIALFDLNMGCPVGKVTKKGEGCALMRDPVGAEAIVHAAVEAASVPVTVKFRSGWSDEDRNASEFARRVEAAGASAVCIHPRTRGQLYRGRADRASIACIVEAVDVPVYGSGDVFSAEDAQEMFDLGVTAVMVARGAKGNPWIFRRITSALAGDPPPPEPTLDERFAVIREHVRLAIDLFGERLAVPRMRKHIAWYLHGLPDAAEMRREASHPSTQADMEAVLDSFLARLSAH